MNKVGNVGNCIVTASGKYFDLFDPEPYMVDLFDIATGLSNQCRYVGQCPFYSVAEHCVHGLQYCERVGVDPRRWLLHDAHEAYTGDMSRPLKLLLRSFTTQFDTICDRVQYAILRRFSMDGVGHTSDIKTVDNMLLKAEKRFLFPSDQTDWHGFDSIPDCEPTFRRWVPEEAFAQFMTAAESLKL